MSWGRGQPSSTVRGYGSEHRAERARLLPDAYGRLCQVCGWPMLEGQPLELDHVIPVALGGRDGPKRIIHKRCNRKLGSQLGAAVAQAGRWARVQRSRW